MKFVLSLLLLSSVLALESLVDYLKKRVDKSKYPNLNVDKLIEVRVNTIFYLKNMCFLAQQSRMGKGESGRKVKNF